MDQSPRHFACGPSLYQPGGGAYFQIPKSIGGSLFPAEVAKTIFGVDALEGLGKRALKGAFFVLQLLEGKSWLYGTDRYFSDLLGCCRRNVQYMWQALEKAGIIKRERDKDGRRFITFLKPLAPKKEKKTDPKTAAAAAPVGSAADPVPIVQNYNPPAEVKARELCAAVMAKGWSVDLLPNELLELNRTQHGAPELEDDLKRQLKNYKDAIRDVLKEAAAHPRE